MGHSRGVVSQSFGGHKPGFGGLGEHGAREPEGLGLPHPRLRAVGPRYSTLCCCGNSFVSRGDAALVALLEDDLLAKRLPELEASVQAELRWALGIGDVTWHRLPQHLQTGSPRLLKSQTPQATSTAAAFLTNRAFKGGDAVPLEALRGRHRGQPPRVGFAARGPPRWMPCRGKSITCSSSGTRVSSCRRASICLLNALGHC